MTPDSIKKLRRSTLGLVFLTIFLDLVGFGLFVPIIANIARSFNASASEAAALSTWFSLGTLIASLFLGRLSDRIGRRRILIFTIFLSALAQLATGFAQTYLYLVVCRFVAGLASGNIAVAQACIADITVPKERGRSMIIIGLAFGFGFAIGPALGGLIARLFPDNFLMVLGITAASLNVINLIAVQSKLPETNHKFPSSKIQEAVDEVKAAQTLETLEQNDKRENAPKNRQGIRLGAKLGLKSPISSDLNRLVAEKGFVALLAMQFIQMFGFVGVETIMPLALQDAYHLDNKDIFDLFTFMGITIILANGVLARPLLKKLGEFATLNIGQILVMGSIAAIPFFAPDKGAITLILITMATGSALFNPALSALVSRLAPSDIQGFALGANQSLASGARILGPLCMGLLYQSMAGANSLYVSSGILMAATLFSIAGMWGVRQKLKLEGYR
jgi:predicted MFS family arabinose efflux permease